MTQTTRRGTVQQNYSRMRTANFNKLIATNNFNDESDDTESEEEENEDDLSEDLDSSDEEIELISY